MANVVFKRGTQAALANATATDGTFYLTTDTHRLFVAQGNNIVPVNEGVITVANVAALQDVAVDLTENPGLAGSFYYATAENVLCVWNGKKWVQINPDTNTTNSGLDIAFANVTGNSNTKKVSVTVTDSANNTVSDDIYVAGSGDVTVAQSGSTLTIGSTPYQLTVIGNGTDTTGVSLAQGESVKGQFQIEAGDNVNFTGVTSSGNTATAVINAKDTTLNTVSSANNSTAGFDVTVTDTDTNTDTATIDPIVKVGTNEVHYVSGKADLSNVIYTKSQVDEKFRALNPMVYKGTLTTTTLPTANVSNGDTYMVAVAGGIPVTIDGTATTAKAGDLLVAQGTENSSTGYIPAANITWSLVPSGDEAAKDTTYHGEALAGGLNLVDSNSNTVAGLTIEGQSSYITVTSANTTDDENSNVITIGHATRTQTHTTGTSAAPQADTQKTIEPITALNFDGAGHVVGYTTREMHIYPSKTEIASTIAASNNVGTATFTETLTYDVGSNSQPVTSVSSAKTFLSLKGSNISVKTNSTDKQLELAFEWGSF